MPAMLARLLPSVSPAPNEARQNWDSLSEHGRLLVLWCLPPELPRSLWTKLLQLWAMWRNRLVRTMLQWWLGAPTAPRPWTPTETGRSTCCLPRVPQLVLQSLWRGEGQQWQNTFCFVSLYQPVVWFWYVFPLFPRTEASSAPTSIVTGEQQLESRAQAVSELCRTNHWNRQCIQMLW